MAQKEISIPGSPLSGAAMVSNLVDLFESIASNRSGASRPSDVQNGEIWVDTSGGTMWTVKIFTGTADVTLFSVNTSTQSFVTSVANGGTGAANAADARAALGLILGQHVQAYNANIVIAAAGKLPELDGSLLTNLAGPTIATNGEALDATNNTKMMTPYRTKQSIFRYRSHPGAIGFYFGSSVPTDIRALVCDGGTYSRDDYPDLWAYHLNNGGCLGDGDGFTSFTVPNLMTPNVFLRAIPPGGTVGLYQADELRSHSHTYGRLNFAAHTGSTGGGTGGEVSSSGTTGSTGGSETRSKNRQYLPIIYY